MSTGICHFSGLPIDTKDDVILLPIEYSKVDTSPLIYGTSSHCSPFLLPVIAKYNGYNSIDGVQNQKLIEILRKYFEKDLYHSINKDFHLGRVHGFFVRKEHKDILQSEFISDSEIIKELNKKESDKLFDVKFKTNEDFVNSLNNCVAISSSGSSSVRYGYILIKKDIFEKYIQQNYSEQKDKILNNLKKISVKNEVFSASKGSHSSEIENALEFFNDDTCLRYVKDIFYSSEENKELILEQLVLMSLIHIVYRDINKSFYPITNTYRTMEYSYNYHKIIADEIKLITKNNLKKYSKSKCSESFYPSNNTKK